jgi:Tfp pilus assembly protein PilO
MSPLDVRLSKEDSQKLLLAAMVALMVGVAYWHLALKPISVKKKLVAKEVAAKRAEYQKNSALVAAAPKVEDSYAEARDELLAVQSRQLPPLANSIAWANDLLLELAEVEGIAIEIQAINEGGSDRLTVGRGGPAPLFEDYLIQVDLKGGYHDLGRFLAGLEARNPYVRVDSLAIRKSTREDPRLAITLTCAFPRLTEEGFPPSERPDAELPRVQAPKAEAKPEGKN